MKKLFFLIVLPFLLFSGPNVLSNPGVNAVSPQVVVAADSGNAVAAWIENGVIQTREQLYGGSWDSIQTLGSGITTFKMDTDDSGNVIIVWIQDTLLTYATKTIGGSWSSPAVLSLTDASEPNLDIDNSGNIVVVWVRGGNIETATKLFGQAWAEADVIAATQAGAPVVSIGSSGLVATLWHGYDTSIYRIYYSFKTLAGGTWDAATALTGTLTNATNPAIDISSDSETAALWYEFDLANDVYSNVFIQFATKTSGGDWTTPTTFTSASNIRQENFQNVVHYDEFSDILAAWLNTYDGSIYKIEASMKLSSDDWKSPVILWQSLYSLSSTFDVASPGDGNVTLAAPYMNEREGNAIQILTSDANLTSYYRNWWSPPVNYSINTANGNPCIEAAKIGNTLHKVIAWECESSGYTVVHSITTDESVLLPPTNGQVTQVATDYILFTDYCNVVSWDASASPTVQGYAIFRNGLFLDTVSGNTLTYTDHNQGQNIPVTYWVIAYESKANLSPRVVINYAPAD